MNISFLCHNFDDLYTLLARMNIKFNIIGKTETRLKKITHMKKVGTPLNFCLVFINEIEIQQLKKKKCQSGPIKKM